MNATAINHLVAVTWRLAYAADLFPGPRPTRSWGGGRGALPPKPPAGEVEASEGLAWGDPDLQGPPGTPIPSLCPWPLERAARPTANSALYFIQRKRRMAQQRRPSRPQSIAGYKRESPTAKLRPWATVSERPNSCPQYFPDRRPSQWPPCPGANAARPRRCRRRMGSDLGIAESFRTTLRRLRHPGTAAHQTRGLPEGDVFRKPVPQRFIQIFPVAPGYASIPNTRDDAMKRASCARKEMRRFDSLEQQWQGLLTPATGGGQYPPVSRNDPNVSTTSKTSNDGRSGRGSRPRRSHPPS